MALREFDDAAGARWRVWDTVPVTTGGLADSHRRGWLTFDNGRERRRLAPVPDRWEMMPDDRLRLLLRVAERRDRLGRTESERRVGERREADRRQAERRSAPVERAD